MHAVIETDDGVWSVVYSYVWEGNTREKAIQDFDKFGEAAALCSYLNGGLKPELADRLINSLKIGGGLNK